MGPLIVVAAIAPYATMGLSSVLIFGFETLPGLIRLNGAASELKDLMGYTSLGPELARSLGRLLYDLLLGPFVAVPFGLIGAAIFLFPAFLIASLRDNLPSHMVAGGLAGAVHAATGLLVAPLIAGSTAWIGLLLGLLPYGFRNIAAITTAIGAPLAGILVGYLYFRMAGAGRIRWAAAQFKG